jgi:hypothetical protein
MNSNVGETVNSVLSNLWGKLLACLIILLVVVLVSLTLFRWTCVNLVDNYQMAYRFDLRTGKVSRIEKTGYVVTPPMLVKVHTIDLRPMQVCINANKRVLNCKLVEFNPAGFETFISWHGRNDYDGQSDVTGGLNDILKSYAYDGSGKTYPFLRVIRELKPEEVASK